MCRQHDSALWRHRFILPYHDNPSLKLSSALTYVLLRSVREWGETAERIIRRSVSRESGTQSLGLLAIIAHLEADLERRKASGLVRNDGYRGREGLCLA